MTVSKPRSDRANSPDFARFSTDGARLLSASETAERRIPPRALDHQPVTGPGARRTGPPGQQTSLPRNDRALLDLRDPSHFARRFRAAYGISPHEWRPATALAGG
ncbi:helix-turn-helix transcriptional regulator [Nocardia sp. CA-119907]|uniref:helix-turn-helix transcriptional regulator n=1 Tax=Nocardia sp. CA-119907 TaxID=3239973 RepID=UPI003D96E8BE